MEKLTHMIAKNSPNKKVIKIVTLILTVTFLSCTSIRNSENDVLTYYLEDFIKTYQSYDFEEPLEVIMISVKKENNSIEYFINDAPREFILTT